MLVIHYASGPGILHLPISYHKLDERKRFTREVHNAGQKKSVFSTVIKEAACQRTLKKGHYKSKCSKAEVFGRHCCGEGLYTSRYKCRFAEAVHTGGMRMGMRGGKVFGGRRND